MNPLKCICIDDSEKPNEIPNTHWPKLHQEYTIIKTIKMNTQGGIQGVILAEIDLKGMYPYKYFRASRFGLTQEMLDKMLADQSIEQELVETI